MSMRSRRGGSFSACVAVVDAALGFCRGRRADLRWSRKPSIRPLGGNSGLVVQVTPASSVSFFRSEFNDFLYASIGADRNDMPLSVLSALSRLNLDPWQEAAELRDLPKDAATKRLAGLIAQLPRGPAKEGLTAISDRLIELLPHGTISNAPFENASRLRGMSGIPVAKALVCAVLGIAALLIIAMSREQSPSGIRNNAPAQDTRSPPQTIY